ncbi:MAG: serine/threonine-protein kinase, partial [Myxococcota bacterium]
MGGVMSERFVGLVLPGDHRLERPLGSGAMGEVWVGTTRAGREVAIKFLSERVRYDTGATQRFEREWQMASRIDSPHVVQMIEKGHTSDGLPFIVMELLDGESLEARLDREGTIGAPETIRILGQMAHALDTAHAIGIVHRDIKPENILLCRGDGRVKLLDFGLAKPFDERGFSLTQTGILMGTPYYMSPEQISAGGKDFDGRADQWAMAGVAYRMLLGHLAFDAETLHALVFEILKGSYRPLAPNESGLAPFFARAFDPDRERRFGSAAELVADLARHLDADAEASTELAATMVADPSSEFSTTAEIYLEENTSTNRRQAATLADSVTDVVAPNAAFFPPPSPSAPQLSAEDVTHPHWRAPRPSSREAPPEPSDTRMSSLAKTALLNDDESVEPRTVVQNRAKKGSFPPPLPREHHGFSSLENEKTQVQVRMPADAPDPLPARPRSTMKRVAGVLAVLAVSIGVGVIASQLSSKT